MSADLQQALALRDIHLPPAPSVWPLAPGWWVVAVIFLVLLAWAARAVWRQRQFQRHRQGVFDALSRLERGLDSGSPEALASMSALLRRIALARFPREQIAMLSGVEWLRFLDRSGGKGRFVDGPGRVLASGPYRRSLPDDLDAAGLAALVREWIDANIRSKA